ncbi:MAG: type II toxin-antitoxin system VapC family toxin [bacterium]|nr:type II toxin-antitoxin system VapC family toxin [bacterium]
MNFYPLYEKIVRQKDITTDIALSVISCFNLDYDKFHWIELGSDIVYSASNFLMKHAAAGLRTLDSLQLACAYKLKDSNCACFTSDKLLLELFKKENLNTVIYDPG